MSWTIDQGEYNNIADWFSNQSITGLIKNFPYKEFKCRFCGGDTTLTNAIHIQDHPEHFKALYICHNSLCDIYDLEHGRAYAKVYYSSEDALRRLEADRIWYDPPTKR